MNLKGKENHACKQPWQIMQIVHFCNPDFCSGLGRLWSLQGGLT